MSRIPIYGSNEITIPKEATGDLYVKVNINGTLAVFPKGVPLYLSDAFYAVVCEMLKDWHPPEDPADRDKLPATIGDVKRIIEESGGTGGGETVHFALSWDSDNDRYVVTADMTGEEVFDLAAANKNVGAVLNADDGDYICELRLAKVCKDHGDIVCEFAGAYIQTDDGEEIYIEGYRVEWDASYERWDAYEEGYENIALPDKKGEKGKFLGVDDDGDYALMNLPIKVLTGTYNDQTHTIALTKTAQQICTWMEQGYILFVHYNFDESPDPYFSSAFEHISYAMRDTSQQTATIDLGQADPFYEFSGALTDAVVFSEST